MDITLLSILFSVIIVIIAVFLVVAPLLDLNYGINFDVKMKKTKNDQKQALLSTLNEIEFEYQMKKISEQDYKKMKRQYEKQVGALMEQEEASTTSGQVDKKLMAEIEKEIQKEIEQAKKSGGK